MFWRELGQRLSQRLWSAEQVALYASKAIQILLVVLVAWLVSWLVGRIVRGLLRSRARFLTERHTRTMISVSRSIIRYFIFFFGLVASLRILGIDYAAILAGAGVVGLAVGFGAQTLVRDFISGFFILFEDLISVGDHLTVGDIAGTVERVGLRSTQLRGFDGTLFVIPNGELTRFGNQNRGFMRALVAVDIAYEQDAEKGLAVAQAAADRWYERSRDIALEPPTVQGLIALGESGIKIRVLAKVKAMEHWGAERSLRLELKRAFDEAGVEIPFPRRVVYTRADSGPTEPVGGEDRK